MVSVEWFARCMCVPGVEMEINFTGTLDIIIIIIRQSVGL